MRDGEGAARSAAPFSLPLLPAMLFRRERWIVYVAVATVLSLAGAALLATIVRWLFPVAAGPDLGEGQPALLLFVGIAIVSPFLETLLMSGPLLLAQRLAGPRVAVVFSAILWGVLHSLLAPIWGLSIWWPFLIFSIAFLVWRPAGYWRAVGTVGLIHALNNAAPAAMIAFSNAI